MCSQHASNTIQIDTIYKPLHVDYIRNNQTIHNEYIYNIQTTYMNINILHAQWIYNILTLYIQYTSNAY